MALGDEIRQMEEYFLSRQYLELPRAEKHALFTVFEAVKALQIYETADLHSEQSTLKVDSSEYIESEETEVGKVYLSFLVSAIRGIMSQFKGHFPYYKIYQANRYLEIAMKEACKENGFIDKPKPKPTA